VLLGFSAHVSPGFPELLVSPLLFLDVAIEVFVCFSWQRRSRFLVLTSLLGCVVTAVAGFPWLRCMPLLVSMLHTGFAMVVGFFCL
jgi:hypothetical protein